MDDLDITREFIIESTENLARLDQELVQLEQDPNNKELLASVFRTMHTIKGTSGMLGFSAVERISHLAENLLSQLRNGERKLSTQLTSLILESVDAVKDELKAIESSGSEQGIPHDKLEAALAHACENKNEVVPTDLSPQHQQTDPAPEKEAASPTSGASDSTIRVDVGLLDRLMNLVGELVLARNQILQFSATHEHSNLNASSQRLDLITTELQEGVMKTRMQPIGNIWNKFPRTVRDVAVGCGKNVRIEMDGEETELDKTIIEAIKDPLTHLVRNSVDHGIETPDARKAAGKPEEGRVFLRAFHEGGQVIIEITDDGHGLDITKIKNKAVQKGLITAAQADQMNEREVTNLVFLPGFSTAEKVSNVSGRGVGMDVVRTHIERIGGTVDLQSSPGQGTTVRMKIPLTLAIIPALIVTSAGDRYAIPQVSLLELVRLESENARKGIELIHGVPVYRLRGTLLPLVYLNRALGDPSKRDLYLSQELPDFATIRDKHQQWLRKLREVLDGKSEVTAQESDSEASCELSKWIKSVIGTFGHMPELKSMEAAHTQFHNQVRETLRLKCQGEVAQAALELERVDQNYEVIGQALTLIESKLQELDNVNIVVLRADDRQFGLIVDEINDTEEIVVKPLAKQLKSVNAFAGATIMGDGRVALIIDVLGLAQRANVVATVHERSLADNAEARAQGSHDSAKPDAVLLFQNGQDGRMAIDLSLVARLEEFPESAIEISGDREVVQYRGQIMPLLRVSELLKSSRHKMLDISQGPVHVVVYTSQGRNVGLLVDRILDIVEESLVVQHDASRPGVLGSAVIQKRVTDIIDVPALIAAAYGNQDSGLKKGWQQ